MVTMETLQTKQKECANLTMKLICMKEQGLANTSGYNTVLAHRSKARNYYRHIYTEYINEIYGPDAYRHEIIKRYGICRESVKSMDESYEKIMAEEELIMLKRAYTNDINITIPRQFFAFERSFNDSKSISVLDIEFELNALKSIIPKLTPSQQEAVQLVYMEGKSQSEAAVILGKEKSSLSRLLRRAKPIIQRELSRDVTSYRKTTPNVLDLSLSKTWKDVCNILTDYNMLVLVLYLHEGATYFVLEDILQVNKSSICRNIKRSICKLLNYVRSDTICIVGFERMVEYVDKQWNKIMDQTDLNEYIGTRIYPNTDIGHGYDNERKYNKIGLICNIVQVQYNKTPGSTKIMKRITKYAKTHKRGAG